MSKRIFVSYSSPDQAKADSICQALEAAGISCWIAPRDLSAGSQWGGGIVRAIEECEAVVVVFSAAANNSPQVAREMELAVSKRRPLVPIRVANDQPTDDMQYFLGVSHWFNAFTQPIGNYLPDIVSAVKNVLARERSPWTSMARRMPQTKAGMIIAAGAGAVALAVLVAWLMKPSFPSNESPLAGRWEASIDDGKGGKADCIVDVQKTSLSKFSDSCPPPLMGAGGSLNVVKDGMLAPTVFKSGDSGTYSFMGGSANGFAGAFRIGWFGGLTTRDAKFGEISWSSISQDGPLKSGMDHIVEQPAPWPLKDMPGIARRSRDYMRAKWQPDAVLTGIDVKLLKSNEAGAINIKTADGGLELKLEFYSPSTQQGASFSPMSPYDAIFGFGVVNRSNTRPLPDDFLDLPDAVAVLKANGMRANQIYEAQLEDWGRETSAGRARMHGVEWMIDSQLEERFVVRATK
jgi:TIR domain